MKEQTSYTSDMVAREEVILEYWQKNDIFKKTLERDASEGEYVFHDGPPFATGTPHYGHLVASAIKDAIPRYWTMRGFRVERKWGWDCHGLPIENIVEKELGTKSKKEIEELGIKKFNDLCRERIFTYVDAWNKLIPRFGRWADMDEPYRTMDRDYMESEWHAFKALHDRGLIYEDYRTMHICPRCETTLAQAEVAEGYADVKDISVVAKFALTDEPNTYLLAWTTTPWTLPGNAALAVGEDISYKKVVLESDTYYIAAERLQPILKMAGIEDFEEAPVTTVRGSELVGKTYRPLFDYYMKDEALTNRENGWRVYAADFVNTEEGTGIVHIAPAFGSDDMELGKREQLPFIQHVGMNGRFKPEVSDFADRQVKPKEEPQATDIEIVKYLAHNGALFAKEKITHSYPHCWRCDTPLLNYATSSWFVAVQKIRDELIANGEQTTWSPAHVKEGRWGQWLAGARDWSISRQRFWANTIPVWRCASCDEQRIFGSVAELEEASGTTVTDLHKDVVDEITVACACGNEMHRVPDVLDTWFDSGSVPFASYHYPFENESKVEERIPANFIAEGQDQISKWFYYQHVLAGALFGKPAFTNVVVNGIVLAEDGKKMSKRLQNYPDPVELIERYGADAIRLYLLSSPVVRMEQLSFSESGVDEVSKKVLGRLANVVAFYQLYATTAVDAAESSNELDRWIRARTQQLVSEVERGMESYELDRATRPIAEFVDDLSTWYVRRSRERFKGGGADAACACATLRFALLTFAKASAPFIPFTAEWVWRELAGEGESVHLAQWPEVGAPDTELLEQMEVARGVVSRALEQRAKKNITVRVPVLSITLKTEIPELLTDIVLSEVNAKNLYFDPNAEEEVVLDTTLTPELEEEGRKRNIIRVIQQERKKAGLSISDDGTATVCGDESIGETVTNCNDEIRAATGIRELTYESGDALSAEVQKV